MTHIVFDGMSNVSARRYEESHTQIVDVSRRDGGILVVIEQPNKNRSFIDENDRIALDEQALLKLYQYLHSKFCGA